MDEEILSLAVELGGLAEGEEQGLLLCCQLAMEELAGLLRPGVAPVDCGAVFRTAAAKMALGDWLALRRDTQPRKFTAGDVTVEQGAGDGGALRRQALRQMAGWLIDPAFFLREVRG